MYKTFISISTFLLLIGCSADTDATSTEQQVEDTTTVVTSTVIIEDVDPAEFQALQDKKKGLIIDVRTPEEFAEGHIDGAVNINFYDENFQDYIDTLDPNTPVQVYCMAGGRSGKTRDLLESKGFKEVYNLEGGYGNYPYGK